MTPSGAEVGEQPDRGAVAFAERVIALLDEGTFTATYKFALLLALLDVCLERTDASGRPPTTVSTRDLARRVIELYWPQTNEYAGLGEPTVLRQNKKGQAEIIRDIRRFREKYGPDPSATLAAARLGAPRGYDRLIDAVEWKLIEMPLPRLQVMGGVHDAFIYRIGWDTSVRQADARAPGFDRRVHFVGRAAEYLTQLGGLLRPLIETKWVERVLRINRNVVADAGLPEFMFGAERISLAAVRPLLREAQSGRCFYCGGQLRRDSVDVDHFVPWARRPDDGLENLVAAHPGCNNSKRDFLAATPHLEGWLRRFDRSSRTGAVLREAGAQLGWDSHPQRTLSIARGIYLRVPRDARLWLARDRFEPADPGAIAALLAG
ncbi:MAG: HNH endonuclease domain-containing protein [Acidobacteriota bacterium]|nr:HNH endonuclease domain-containing protein [Acidobacteriota bacterium]